MPVPLETRERLLLATGANAGQAVLEIMESGAADDLIMRSPINLGHAMRLKVVARPMPASQFAEWVFARTDSAGEITIAKGASDAEPANLDSRMGS